ncbi:suppressor of forked protein (Suf) domain-containing protein [Hirsutella rhossiliensis]|uniref:mRNA 3'-end-processing protein RNA14 n=1 Tax=Hirsutella rhossiliensis TaxID=111463 RepID=A0A9P8SJ79_9HYPO|nr:suppressor of forked protein (Suf) domain-containing protein [Hirsutella rhossiliensis]KAH0964606.1 suppressor of forked protein (Suf) domain-containing protein [Hirsutella rhossiliensis]
MASEEAAWDGGGFAATDDAAAQRADEQADEFAQDIGVAGAAQDENDADDGADYDPESVSFDATPQIPDKSASATTSQRPPTAKPKMSGGFLVEVSDDEDDVDNQDPPEGALQTQGQAAPVGNGVSPAPPVDAPSSTPQVVTLDPVALLEARIKEDPRGDMDAWLNLVADHKRRGRLDDLRKVYNRFAEVFPQAADIWIEWIEMELGIDNFVEAERLFGRSLMSVLNVKLWTVYLNYIRRRNDLTNDATGQARRTVAQSYDFVIDNVGVDRDSGNIWQDYINFVKSGPGQVGGTGWQDQQKMDQLRKAYQRAIAVPMLSVNNMWKEYDQFEMALNKVTGRKFIQERSPGYMSAKSANIALDNMMRHLKRNNLPRLPPAPGFDGDEEFRHQVELWKKWIAWEKDDPLVLKDDEPQVYKQRVLYCYKQALMALRFWPEIWVDAAAWCLENEGIAANPESVLLAFKHADHIEAHYPEKEGDRSEYAKAVRQPYDAVLETLYKMGDKVKEREKLEESIEPVDEDEDEDDEDKKPKKSPMEERVTAIQNAYAAESQLLSRTISFVWVALARAMRRIQGKGNQTEGGLRKVFTDARQKGRLTSDVYVAVAMLESVVYKDPVGSKIFERGARLFPNDENFMIEYIKFLHSKDDTTNARVVFETCANRLVSKPETLHKAKALYAYFHKYESQYGELSQISKLEDRMRELFPYDPKLSYFTARYSSDRFDPVAAPIIISKTVQMRPKQIIPTIEQPVSARNSIPPPRQEQSPRPQFARATASPKRPFGVDDEELNPPKRLARGASPLKGAAGRRLDQQRRNQSSALHRDITFLLGILPRAPSYDAQRLNPTAMVSLLRDTPLPDYSTWRAKTGGQYRAPAPTHGRQTSGDYGGRPISPYGRLAASSGGYRGSPLRPESGGIYAANPYAPPEAGAVPPVWPPLAGGHGAPSLGPPGQYGGYRYQ